MRWVPAVAWELDSTPCFCKVQNSKKKFLAPAWKIKSRRNKKRIAQFVYKSRDESNESNQAVIRREIVTVILQ